jgi:hypothetical protein
LEGKAVTIHDRVVRIAAALLPTGPTDLATFIVEAQRLDQAQSLVDVSAERLSVDHGVSNSFPVVDKEESPQRHRLLEEDPVGSVYPLGKVGDPGGT